MTIDLSRLGPQELKNLLVNNAKHSQQEMVQTVVKEMHRLGMATRREFRYLTWNQESVREVLAPFKEIASAVQGNQRTAYTEAGGLKIGRSKDSPKWRWIDSYSAIKTPDLNAVLVCYVKGPGDEPEFQLHLDGALVHTYNADGLSEALLRWQEIAERSSQ
jgi:hypothetical protein